MSLSFFLLLFNSFFWSFIQHSWIPGNEELKKITSIYKKCIWLLNCTQWWYRLHSVTLSRHFIQLNFFLFFYLCYFSTKQECVFRWSTLMHSERKALYCIIVEQANPDQSIFIHSFCHSRVHSFIFQTLSDCYFTVISSMQRIGLYSY